MKNTSIRLSLLALVVSIVLSVNSTVKYSSSNTHLVTGRLGFLLQF